MLMCHCYCWHGLGLMPRSNDRRPIMLSSACH
jgi:hypothetical protein